MKKTLIALSAALLCGNAFAATSQATSAPLAPETQAESQQPTSPQDEIQKLAYTAQNVKAPVEDRVAALRQLSRYPNQNSLVAVARALKNEDALIREAAIVGAEPYKIENRWTMVSPLLSDDIEKVRITAAMNLIRDYNALDDAQKKTIEPAYKELIAHLKTRTGQASQTLLADAYRWHHDWDNAETLYRTLLKDDNKNPQIWLSLADNERGQMQDQKAINILDEALTLLPENADIHYSKALALVRLEKKLEASKEIKKAATLAKTNSYYWYLDGVIQEEFDVTDATKSFEQAYMISGAPEQLYAVCDIYARHNNPKTAQCLEELKKFAPPYVIEKLKQSKISQ